MARRQRGESRVAAALQVMLVFDSHNVAAIENLHANRVPLEFQLMLRSGRLRP